MVKLVASTALLAAWTAGPALAAPGEALFMANCSACHQPTGKGIPGAFPPLASNPFVQGPPDQVIATVLDGRGGMPTFKGDLDDPMLAAVLTYVRSAWGNSARPVAPDEVAAIRAGTAPPPPKSITAH
jgi:mono/diheme cytochrome c family protein